MTTVVITQIPVTLIIITGVILHWISSNREKWGREKYTYDEKKFLLVWVCLVGTLLAIRFTVLMLDCGLWTYLVAESDLIYGRTYNVLAFAVLLMPTFLYITMLSYGKTKQEENS